MARERSPEEVEQEYVSVMGAPLGRLFYALSNEVTWLHEYWNEYRALYGTNERRIDLLNEAAGLFFRLAQDALWEQTLLYLCRLTDPPDSCGKANLTIRRIPLLAATDISTELESLVDAAVDNTAFARDWRNRRIAHSDLRLALGEGASPLLAASRLKVQQAIDSIRVVLQRMSEHYMKSTLLFEPLLGGPGNAECLLYVIRDGLTAARAREIRMREGKFLEEDINPPAPI